MLKGTSYLCYCCIKSTSYLVPGTAAAAVAAVPNQSNFFVFPLHRAKISLVSIFFIIPPAAHGQHPALYACRSTHPSPLPSRICVGVTLLLYVGKLVVNLGTLRKTPSRKQHHAAQSTTCPSKFPLVSHRTIVNTSEIKTERIYNGAAKTGSSSTLSGVTAVLMPNTNSIMQLRSRRFIMPTSYSTFASMWFQI